VRNVTFARALAVKWLRDRGAILRQNLTTDGRGGRKPAGSDAWPVVANDVKMAVLYSQKTPMELVAGEQIVSEGAFNVMFKNGTDIKNTDRVRVATLDNRVFRMIGPRYASDEILRVMAAEEVT